MFKFRFSVKNRSFPGLCLAGGIVMVILSIMIGQHPGLEILGVILIFVSFVLYVNARSGRKGR